MEKCKATPRPPLPQLLMVVHDINVGEAVSVVEELAQLPIAKKKVSPTGDSDMVTLAVRTVAVDPLGG